MTNNTKLEDAKRQREALSIKAAPGSTSRLTLGQTKKRRETAVRKTVVPDPGFVGNQFFTVLFGNTQIGFQRVSNLQTAVEREELAEGGLNDQVHVLTKPGRQSGTLTLEKVIVDNEELHKIISALAPGTRINVPVIVSLFRKTASGWEEIRAWGFNDGIVVRWELNNLDGLGSELAVEKLEIAHEGLVEIDLKNTSEVTHGKEETKTDIS